MSRRFFFGGGGWGRGSMVSYPTHNFRISCVFTIELFIAIIIIVVDVVAVIIIIFIWIIISIIIIIIKYCYCCHYHYCYHSIRDCKLNAFGSFQFIVSLTKFIVVSIIPNMQDYSDIQLASSASGACPCYPQTRPVTFPLVTLKPLNVTPTVT